ncbi:acyl-CoA thioester hydrolase [Peptoclostridium litorale DSM 5388]|uniref:4-hydroxybenzoyl-CoA thioesterase n=1 Tax=Peptoclostridium litorale DSM 5388 TaxID=1121324 RepID=A0A069RDK9_PEPLI|nr:thioesterase family protein [Peptoclostridium litorale]KDR95139.1 4-hydroxybenzoyl-CoA thioesterase [Peptoclostridium litorale DSM 5388]SIN74379.1 acyl-CoA thioester hydrolase [Peptoclostridium litorale DSM 5388]
MHSTQVNLSVRYAETDNMGVAHHSVYYVWFEVGRSEHIKSSGVSYSQMEEEGVLLPLSESSCKYIKGLKYEEEFILNTYIEKLTGARVIFGYEICKKSDGIVCAKGQTVHAFIDEDFKVLNIKKSHPHIWQKINALYQKNSL